MAEADRVVVIGDMPRLTCCLASGIRRRRVNFIGEADQWRERSGLCRADHQPRLDPSPSVLLFWVREAVKGSGLGWVLRRLRGGWRCAGHDV